MRLVLLLCLVVAVMAPAGNLAAGGQSELETVAIETPDDRLLFQVEVADDENERARGLMFRRSLAEGEGMIFLYPSPRPVAFWMKNTYLPLDLVFIAEGGLVTGVARNASPLSEEPIPSVVPVIAVLEINGGLAQRLGIEPGARVRHPIYFP
jgi:uncharacterized membrane protein (UPF0127 family)